MVSRAASLSILLSVPMTFSFFGDAAASNDAEPLHVPQNPVFFFCPPVPIFK
jgi:hypothetical protein